MEKHSRNMEQEQRTRPPVVVILGHVDHGKSSLLEAIREDVRITQKESGGITQHIGAYQARHEGKDITFLDTPGHEAFSAMRSRGANVADLGVLVVAADDGVKPQTEEAISQAKEAGLTLMVAVTKADRPGANPQMVRQQLAERDVLVEGYGGQVPIVETSAVTKQGIPDLLEMIALMAEVESLDADSSRPAEGVVIESFLDRRRGPAATLLVKNGTLRTGDVVSTPSVFGKARILEDFRGESVQEAVPSMPVLMVGLSRAPRIGEEFLVVEDEGKAKERLRGDAKAPRRSVSSDALSFPVILKADVQGSLEAFEQMLGAIPQERIALRIVDASVGDIGENDVKLARSTGAVVLSFRSRASSAIAGLADREGVRIESSDIIYDLVQRVRSMLEQELGTETVRMEIGSLEVLAIFRTEKDRQIVGGRVKEGEVRKQSAVEVRRAGEVVGTGKALAVKKGQQDVERAVKGDECGILYAGQERVQEGDTIAFFVTERRKGTLTD